MRLNSPCSEGFCRHLGLQTSLQLLCSNPMWSDKERQAEDGIVAVEAYKPSLNLNSRTFTRQHPHCFSILLSLPSLSTCPDNCTKCQLAKAPQRRRKKVSVRSNPAGAGEKKGRLRFLSLALPLSLCACPTALFLDENVPLDEGIRRPL